MTIVEWLYASLILFLFMGLPLWSLAGYAHRLFKVHKVLTMTILASKDLNPKISEENQKTLESVANI